MVADIRARQCEAAQQALKNVVAEQGVGIEVEELVVIGRPHEQIVSTADERQADLIVMGVRGRGAVDMTLFGSTTNQVVRRARCPVLTVRVS